MGWYFGEEIVEPKLWNFSKVENNVFSRKFRIFNEDWKHNCERTVILSTPGKKSHLQSTSKPKNGFLVLVSQTL